MVSGLVQFQILNGGSIHHETPHSPYWYPQETEHARAIDALVLQDLVYEDVQDE
jgi:hypothetical protein